MADDNDQVKSMDEARLWKTLDNMASKLDAIEKDLSTIVRLEERVAYHHETLARYGKRLDEHDSRIRKTENWQSENNGKSGASGKVIAWIVGSVSAVVTGVMTAIATLLFKG